MMSLRPIHWGSRARAVEGVLEQAPSVVEAEAEEEEEGSFEQGIAVSMCEEL